MHLFMEDTVLGMAMEDTELDTALDTADLDTLDLMVVTDTPPTVPMEVTILARGPLMLRLRTDMEDTAQGMDLGMEATDMAVLDMLVSVMAVGMGMVLATATTDKKLSLILFQNFISPENVHTKNYIICCCNCLF
jgi:hypothetical protein